MAGALGRRWPFFLTMRDLRLWAGDLLWKQGQRKKQMRKKKKSNKTTEETRPQPKQQGNPMSQNQLFGIWDVFPWCLNLCDRKNGWLEGKADQT